MGIRISPAGAACRAVRTGLAKLTGTSSASRETASAPIRAMRQADNRAECRIESPPLRHLYQPATAGQRRSAPGDRALAAGLTRLILSPRRYAQRLDLSSSPAACHERY